MTTPKLIALTGAAGAGKSTAATALISRGFVLVKFAAPLKSMMRALYRCQGLDSDDIHRRIEGDLKEIPDPALGGISPRAAMQSLGTTWGREAMADDFWVERWRASAGRFLDQGISVVCDDCRFENEAAVVRALGGRIVEIQRPGLKRISLSGHVSEAGVQPCQIAVNDAAPADLSAAVLTAATSVAPRFC